jgi:hypothetical protein
MVTPLYHIISRTAKLPSSGWSLPELFSTTMEASAEQMALSALPEGLYILSRRGEGQPPAYARIVKVSR